MPDSYFTNCTNADFIAHSRTDVPALCDALEEARKALNEIVEMCADTIALVDPREGTVNQMNAAIRAIARRALG
jgi:hypothetical protein